MSNHLLLLVGIALATALCVASVRDASYMQARCTTDTDCAARFGGNGDPVPAR